jgi:hypothetical protein
MNSLHEARRKLAEELGATIGQVLAQSQDPAPVILVTAPGGVGKSHMVAQLLRGHRVVWLARRKEQQADLEHALGTPLPDVQPLRSSEADIDIEKRPARSDAAWCSEYPRIIQPLEDAGLGRFVNRRACMPCPRRGSCPYISWKPTSKWLFAPHVWLSIPINDPDIYAGRDIVVIDESPLDIVLTSSVMRMDVVTRMLQLVEGMPRPPKGRAREAVAELLGMILHIASSPPPGRSRIAIRELAADLGYDFRHSIPKKRSLLESSTEEFLDMRRTGFAHEKAGLPPLGLEVVDPLELFSRLHTMDTKNTSDLKILGQFFDALVFDDRYRPSCVLRLANKPEKCAVIVGNVARVPIPSSLPIVVLDATGVPSAYRTLFGERDVVQVDVEVPQSSTVYQITDHRYPSTTLTNPKSTSVARLMKIVDRHKALHPKDKVGIILKQGLLTYPSIAAEIRKRFTEEDIEHFWAERGTNKFKEYDALFVLGAPEIPPDELEGLARAFMSLLPVRPGELPFDYRVQTTQVPPCEDRGLKHPADIVFWEMHQAEYEQALLRGRPFDPEHPKTIYILTNVALNCLNLDIRHASEKELVIGEKQQPPLIERAQELLLTKRQAEDKNDYDQKTLAGWLSVSPSALSQALKKSPDKAKEIKRLLRLSRSYRYSGERLIGKEQER